MILTSYFSNYRKFPPHKTPVAISIYPPRGYSGKKDTSLAPTAEILRLYKNNQIDDEEYVAMYRHDILDNLNPKKVFKKHKHSILLCYEKRGDFCHRHIVSAWLYENGIEAEELINEPPVRIAIIGSRDFDDWKQFVILMDSLVSTYQRVRLVSGGAKGADALAERYAEHSGLLIDVYAADWDKHGRSAGYIRNSVIWANSDLGIAFWDGKSKGTAHSFGLARKQGKELFIWNSNTGTLELNN